MDHNASTALHPRVLDAMLPYMRSLPGNPSSPHWAGRRLRDAIEKARCQVARLVDCDPGEVVFTSCATEANNMAIKGVAASKGGQGRHIITSIVEHPSVLMPCYSLESLGFEITCIDVDREGRIDLKALENAFRKDTILVSIMHANNETGTIFPIDAIGNLTARYGIYLHCDAVQSVGKIPVDFKAYKIDLLALSGHKIYGPQGVGALIMRKGVKCRALLHGGAQEQNRRAGTENVAGIVGLGEAAHMALEDLATESARQKHLRDDLEEGIMANIPGVRRNGDPDHRLPNTTNLSFLDVDSGDLVAALDDAGIAVSSVSACSSGALKTSRVLEAMGLTGDARFGTLRFSLGRDNDRPDVRYVLDVLPDIVRRLRSRV